LAIFKPKAGFFNFCVAEAVAENAIFAGWMNHDNVLAQLAAADVFAGPSKRFQRRKEEVQGLKSIEAMCTERLL